MREDPRAHAGELDTGFLEVFDELGIFDADAAEQERCIRASFPFGRRSRRAGFGRHLTGDFILLDGAIRDLTTRQAGLELAVGDRAKRHLAECILPDPEHDQGDDDIPEDGRADGGHAPCSRPTLRASFVRHEDRSPLWAAGALTLIPRATKDPDRGRAHRGGAAATVISDGKRRQPKSKGFSAAGVRRCSVHRAARYGTRSI